MSKSSSKKSHVSQLLGWVTERLRLHLMKAVAAFLCACWLGISYIVYRVEAPAQGANINTYAEGVWWGIVTFLTVGYGDRYPVTPVGRIFAGILMLAGVVAVGIVTAKISSYFLEKALKEAKRVVDTTKLKNHFVVCGWKEDMHELLEHVLDYNPRLTARDIVLVAAIDQARADEIRLHERLRDLQIVVGDYFQDLYLRQAVPERAYKVLILADQTPLPNGQRPSVTEVDARTVMTAMTLSSIARGTMVAAEVLDPKMDQYMRLAQVSEIIYTREYSRLLLGNASAGTGVSNVISDLIDPKTSTVITTKPLPEELVGKTYAELKSAIETAQAGIVVIGVLENTGNAHTIKELALRQAQKTPDMAKLVSNLKGVKNLKCNQPVFNPEDSYKVPEGSMAIVVENRARAAGGKERGTNVEGESAVAA